MKSTEGGTVAYETNQEYTEISKSDVNLTYFSTSLPSLFSVETMKVPTQDNHNSSWYRAYQQILALSELTTSCDFLDLNNGKRTHKIDRASTVNNVVHISFDAFVRRIQNHYEGKQQELDSPCGAIEELLNKIYSTNTTSPSFTTMVRIWLIYQFAWEVQQSQQMTQHQTHDVSLMEIRRCNSIRRMMMLLQNWMNWSQQYGTLLYQRPPTVNIIFQFFKSMNANQPYMSSNLWSLYTSTIHNNPPFCSSGLHRIRNISSHHPRIQLDRNISSHHPRIQLDRIMLQILSKSGIEWEYYQCQILQSAIRAFCKTIHPNEIIHLYGGHPILWRALLASTKSGRVTDTMWLSRLVGVSTMSNNHPATNTFQQIALRLQRYESLLHSTDLASLRRMERYLWENQSIRNGLPFNSTTCKMLLIKFSKTKTRSHSKQISIGRRTERFFYRAYQILNNNSNNNNITSWYPDVECAYCVIEAYLPPPLPTQYQDAQVVTITNSTQYLLQLRMVDHFLRQFLQQFGFRHHSTVQHDRWQHIHFPYSYQIITRILHAYNDVALLTLDDCSNNVRNSVHVAQLADTLFRYFVIQYRNGRIDTTIERPNHYHVEQLRSIFNICTKSTISNKNINPNSAMIMKRLHRNIDEYIYLLHHKIR